MNENTRIAWVVFTSTDRTEGKGYEKPAVVCDKQATAIRLGKGGYVQGSDCPVKQVTLRYIDGYWCGPVYVIPSTRDDDLLQEKMDKRNAALERAKDAGLSDDDIRLLSGDPQ